MITETICIFHNLTQEQQIKIKKLLKAKSTNIIYKRIHGEKYKFIETLELRNGNLTIVIYSKSKFSSEPVRELLSFPIVIGKENFLQKIIDYSPTEYFEGRYYENDIKSIRLIILGSIEYGDIFGHPIRKGDFVHYIDKISNRLQIGKIKKISEDFITIEDDNLNKFKVEYKQVGKMIFN